MALAMFSLAMFFISRSFHLGVILSWRSYCHGLFSNDLIYSRSFCSRGLFALAVLLNATFFSRSFCSRSYCRGLISDQLSVFVFLLSFFQKRHHHDFSACAASRHAQTSYRIPAVKFKSAVATDH